MRAIVASKCSKNYGTIGTFHLFYEEEAITNPGTRIFNIFWNQYDVDNLMESEWRTRTDSKSWIGLDMDATKFLLLI